MISLSISGLWKTHRLLCCLLLLISAHILFPSNTEAGSDIKVFVDDQLLSLDVAPDVIDGRTLVPLRPIFEAIGADVTWDKDTGKITGIRDNSVIVLYVGEDLALINGELTRLDVAPSLIKSRTMVPARLIAESLGANVVWDETRRAVDIFTVWEEKDQLAEPTPRGNHPGNPGDVAIQGEWIYYSNTADQGKLYKVRTDGTGRTKLDDTHHVTEINVVGEWIYYSPGAGRNPIYKIMTDGSERTKVNNDRSTAVVVVGDWIYYINWDEYFPSGASRHTIYKIKTDGTERTKVNDDYTSWTNIQVQGDWIYYSNRDEGHKIYRIRTDGSGRTRVNDDPSCCINVVDEWIYYCNIDDGYQIYKIKTDGSERTRINEDYSGSLNVFGDWIYYSNVSDKKPTGLPLDIGRLYKIRTDGTERTKINDDNSTNIHVIGDWIYYTLWEEDRHLYRIRPDGTDRSKVY